ncbi:MAG TPA: site-specific DNA-methyltransferase, partial [Gammaproteobacteria bacterium]|nr:site-specific DNA-methyltransferase [Gammaproteobacteria bacterium]
MLIRGDNLPVLARLVEMKAAGLLASTDGSTGARVVYIDPPFSTNLFFRAGKNQPAYDDRITGHEYVEFLRRRLILIRELLSDDGSVFVHLDWKKAHYARVVMDSVFGAENFMNDIVWHYGGRGAKAVSGQFSRNHDNILWYRKSGRCVFNRVYTERRVKKGGGGFRQDPEGRWFKTSPRGDYTDESVAALEKEGRIHRTRNGKIWVKYFLREDGDYLLEDRLVGDVWDDIPDAMHLPRRERTGYPTQKPRALLERIIKASTRPGDLVVDAFCGSGTTAVAAAGLGRRWVAADSGGLAVHTTEKRMMGMGGVGPFSVFRAGADEAEEEGAEDERPEGAVEVAVEGGHVVVRLDGR